MWELSRSVSIITTWLWSLINTQTHTAATRAHTHTHKHKHAWICLIMPPSIDMLTEED